MTRASRRRGLTPLSGSPGSGREASARPLWPSHALVAPTNTKLSARTAEDAGIPSGAGASVTFRTSRSAAIHMLLRGQVGATQVQDPGERRVGWGDLDAVGELRLAPDATD